MRNYTYSFDLIRDTITPDQIISHYGLQVRPRGPGVRCVCPFPTHKGSATPTDFEINVTPGPKYWKFHCFSCGAKGRGVMQFVKLMEGLNADDHTEAARRIYAWFNLGSTPAAPAIRRQAEPVQEAKSEVPTRNPTLTEKAKAAGKDWDGRLKLEYHPYLAERGFSEELCKDYGVGYTTKGYNAGRIAFPIANPDGEIVGYCGRLVDPTKAYRHKDAGEAWEPPRWQMPVDFHKHLELFGIERVKTPGFDTAIVVESFWGVLALARAGIKNGVATMGKDLSDAQAELLKRFRHVILLFDGNAREASAKAGTKLLAMHFDSVKVLFLPDDKQPDHLDPEDLYELF